MKILCCLGVLLAPVAAFQARVPSMGRVSHRAPRTAVRLVEEAPTKPDPNAFSLGSQVTRSQNVGGDRVGTLVVTDGSGSFYNSRTVFQQLHDFGNYAAIRASTGPVVEAKKHLLSRQARYSGLLDLLSFIEGDALSEAMAGADTWLALNADESVLPTQIELAKSAGISRAFVLVCEEGPTSALADVPKLEAALKASGMTYTVMRTGKLVASAPQGGGLILSDLDLPVCEDVARDDVFRFVVEALTLDEANARLFSLCPSEGTVPALKQMRSAGYDRREEVQGLLKGLIKEQVAEEDTLSEEQKAEKAEEDAKSEAEVAAEREEELKALLAKAKKRGEETQARLKYEEEEKAKKRAEQAKYYSPPPEDDDDKKGDAPAADASTEDAEPKKEDDKKDGDEPPLAAA